MIQTLTVERTTIGTYNKTTILRDNKGKVKAIINSLLKHPKKGSKSIIINNNTWLLNWDNVK